MSFKRFFGRTKPDAVLELEDFDFDDLNVGWGSSRPGNATWQTQTITKPQARAQPSTPKPAPSPVPAKVLTMPTKAIREEDLPLMGGGELLSKLLANRLLVALPEHCDPAAADARVAEMSEWLHENIPNPFVIRNPHGSDADLDILFSETKDLLFFKMRFDATDS